MKTYKVELGGRSWSLKYTLDDREEIESAFPKPDGTPGSMGQLVRDHLIGAGAFKVLNLILWAGMRHEEPKLTADKVKTWLSKATEFTTIRRTTWKAVLASGVLGSVIDEPEEEPDAGKVESPEG